jgi:hypothetical protein
MVATILKLGGLVFLARVTLGLLVVVLKVETAQLPGQKHTHGRVMLGVRDRQTKPLIGLVVAVEALALLALMAL